MKLSNKQRSIVTAMQKGATLTCRDGIGPFPQEVTLTAGVPTEIPTQVLNALVKKGVVRKTHSAHLTDHYEVGRGDEVTSTYKIAPAKKLPAGEAG